MPGEIIKTGVIICAGSDVGVFAHGDNGRKLDLMVDYGMSPLGALKSATNIDARIFHWEDSIERSLPV